MSVSLPSPDIVRQQLARIGPLWATDIRKYSQIVKELYEPLLAKSPKQGTNVERDIGYGWHERHRLDVFRPAGAERAPVVVFLHGGAFVRGDKRATAELYDNVLYWFSRQGYVGVNVEYRLAPEAKYPDGATDLALALDWVNTRATRFGGDPGRIFLIGHSAGGTHAASYVFDPAVGRLGRHVKGLVLLSARLRADRTPENPNRDAVAAYFGADESLYEARSPTAHTSTSAVPTLIATAQYENPLLDRYGLEFAWRLSLSRDRPPQYLQLRGHNHMSIVAHFNTEEEFLGREILDFFAAVQDGHQDFSL